MSQTWPDWEHSLSVRMSCNPACDRDDSPEPESAQTGQKRGRPSALELAPRKKPPG
ncbi:hypothetical protein SCLCIDRAFT_22034 [Scleroderma citrinum Foug A]|uniref:Uncharacterized protein n=1 Tax=Scleroderma citrinum Foug A TaxID=1036808 RepID=A0A0C3EE24_9AGAM|nr:hypothetical protein SCLCIDRAFT_22034 [Scleroderma citrinum Foug A]